MANGVIQCPVEEAIQIIGGKWKLLILRSLPLNGPQRYNQLLEIVMAISQKELTRNLRDLTNAGLLARDSGTRPHGPARSDEAREGSHAGILEIADLGEEAAGRALDALRTFRCVDVPSKGGREQVHS